MTLFLKKGHPSINKLKNLKIRFKEYNNSEEEYSKLNIGILNIMPNANDYEMNLLLALASTEKNIQPVWIKSEIHSYKTTPSSHLREFYSTFQIATKNNNLDGLVITGAPVEHLQFKDITYWEELKSIFAFSKNNNIPILGLCWGGLAIGEILGLKKTVYEKKIFGVFESQYNVKNWETTINKEYFTCPHSRFAGYEDSEVLSNESVIPLAYGSETGFFIFSSKDKQLLAHIGHSEYNKDRIVQESLRDLKLKRDDVLKPVNFNVKKPNNNWKSHRKLFFSYWINEIVTKN